VTADNPRLARLRKHTPESEGEAKTMAVQDGDLLVIERRADSRRFLGKFIILIDRDGARIEPWKAP